MLRRRSQIRDYKSEDQLFRNRAIFAFLGIVILICILIMNLYTLQVVQFQDYKTRSNDNRIKIVPIAPNRGLIYDRNGVLLLKTALFSTLKLPRSRSKISGALSSV